MAQENIKRPLVGGSLILILLLIPTVYAIVFLVAFIYYDFDWSKTGVIGDTFGGLTAPFVNLVGAILVYISFEAQRKANKIQQDDLDKSRGEFLATQYFQSYQTLKMDFDRITSKPIDEKKLLIFVIEFEVILTHVIASLLDSEKSKQYLIELLRVKADELKDLNLDQFPKIRKKVEYLNKVIENEQHQ